MSNKITIPEMKTAADLRAWLLQLGTAQVTALNGLLDKVPENLKSEYLGLRDQMNGLLTKLPPLDQVPAANEASWALNSFANTIGNLFQYIEDFRVRFDGMIGKMTSAQTALNGLNEQVTKGELLPKDKVQLAVDGAVTNAVAPLKAEIAAMRKSAVSLCGLPDAPDTVLGAASADFEGALAQAKTNLATCVAKGMALDAKGDNFIRKTVWGTAEALNGEMKTIEEMIGTFTKVTGDPFKGTPSPAPAPTPAPTKKLSVA